MFIKSISKRVEKKIIKCEKIFQYIYFNMYVFFDAYVVSNTIQQRTSTQNLQSIPLKELEKGREFSGKWARDLKRCAQKGTSKRSVHVNDAQTH